MKLCKKIPPSELYLLYRRFVSDVKVGMNYPEFIETLLGISELLYTDLITLKEKCEKLINEIITPYLKGMKIENSCSSSSSYSLSKSISSSFKREPIKKKLEIKVIKQKNNTENTPKLYKYMSPKEVDRKIKEKISKIQNFK